MHLINRYPVDVVWFVMSFMYLLDKDVSFG